MSKGTISDQRGRWEVENDASLSQKKRGKLVERDLVPPFLFLD